MNSVIISIKMPESPSIANAAQALLEVHCKPLGWTDLDTTEWECHYSDLKKISFDTLIIGGCEKISITPKD